MIGLVMECTIIFFNCTYIAAEIPSNRPIVVISWPLNKEKYFCRYTKNHSKLYATKHLNQ